MSHDTLHSLTASNDVPLSAVVAALIDDPVKVDDQSDLSRLAPTTGRVAEATDDGTIYLADGSTWIDVDASTGFEAAATLVDELRSTPVDVRGISSPQQGWEAYHDGSGSNTEGPAFYNGSTWTSTVDGTTIS